MFITYGGMIIHLEFDSCESGISTVDLNETAAKCYQWKRYINSGMREELLDRARLPPRDVYPFRCPTCNTRFTLLSGPFQHVGSQACSQDMESGSIERLVWIFELHYIHGVPVHARG